MQSKFNFQVLAEKGEIYKTPEGNLKQISNKAPSHDDATQLLPTGETKKAKVGGVVLNDAHSVLSDSYTQVMNGDRNNSEMEQAVRISKKEGNSYLEEFGFSPILKSSVSPSKFFLKAQEERDNQMKKLSKPVLTKDKFGFNSQKANEVLRNTLPTDENLYEQVFQIQENKKQYADVNFNKMQFGGSTFPFTNMQKQNMISPEEKKYRNPEKRFEKENTGDSKLDFLYDNDWLLDTPIVGDYLKSKAKNIAEISAYPLRNKEEYDSNEKNYNGQRYTGMYSQLPKNQQISLLDVFFDKQKLQPSKYKPTSDYLEFLPSYSLKNKNIKNIKYLDGTTFEDNVNKKISNYIKSGKYDVDSKEGIKDEKYQEFLKNKNPIYFNHKYDSDLTEYHLGANLAGHKEGIAWDKEKNLPYLSISDAWDFEPQHYSKKWIGQDNIENNKVNERKAYKQSYLMNKAGNPFKIYDRFYFDPKTKEYIPDDKLLKKQFGGMSKANNPLFKYL